MAHDTEKRTRISAHQSFWGKLVTILGTWIWDITQLPIFNDPSTGAPDSLRGMCFVGPASDRRAFNSVLHLLSSQARFYHLAT